MRTLGISVLLIVALSMFPQGGSAATAQGNVQVQVDAAVVGFPDAQPFVDNNQRIQVPLRFVSEQLGYKVDWNKSKSGIAVTLTGQGETVQLTTGSMRATVNGTVTIMDTTPTLSDERVYVPLRFLGELSGFHVQWDNRNTKAILSEQTAPTYSLMAKQQPEQPQWELIKDFKATAYSASALDNGAYAGLDYMGNKLTLGTVAVDPKVIPLGTELYIEGYDYAGLPAGGLRARATDTGGAIKGNKIDIFIPGDRKNALQFGIQKVNVYVLKQ